MSSIFLYRTHVTLGPGRAGETWYEFTGSIKDTVKLDDDGHATFRVEAGKITVWVKQS